MTADLTAKIFHDEDAARAHFQALRWPHGPVCPHCGLSERIYARTAHATRSADGAASAVKLGRQDCARTFIAPHPTPGTPYRSRSWTPVNPLQTDGRHAPACHAVSNYRFSLGISSA